MLQVLSGEGGGQSSKRMNFGVGGSKVLVQVVAVATG